MGGVVVTLAERHARQLAEDIATERMVAALLLVPDEDAAAIADRALALSRVRRADIAGEIAAHAHALALNPGGEQ